MLRHQSVVIVVVVVVAVVVPMVATWLDIRPVLEPELTTETMATVVEWTTTLEDSVNSTKPRTRLPMRDLVPPSPPQQLSRNSAASRSAS